MKKYSELTQVQQSKAKAYFVNKLLANICEYNYRFDDKANGDDFQAHLDAALKKATAMGTPWFCAEYLMDDPYIVAQVNWMALDEAERTMYAEEEDLPVVELVAIESMKL